MLEAINLIKEYPSPRGGIPILSGVSLSLKRGDAVSIMGPSGSGKSTLLYILGALEPPTSGVVTRGDFIALMGPSGSGKSTLLNVLGCLDRPTSGEYYLGDENVATLDDDDLSDIRSKYLGFIFQSYNLLPQYTVVENIEIPLLYQGGRLTEATRERCIELAEMVGLGDRLDHRPAELSGGEKQRVALARAMILNPLLMLCDEPTGNLDHASAGTVASLLLEMNKVRQSILIVVTHSAELSSRFPIQFELLDRNLCPKKK